MAANTVTVERTTTHDIYKGPIPSLIEASIIEQRHLEPQPGRRKGYTGFMPDGSAIPEGATPPNYLPGYVAVQVLENDCCMVKWATSVAERRAQEDAEPTLRIKSEFHQRYYGNREGLLRDGIPEAWINGLPIPGKKRGRRVIQDGERRIEVSASEVGIGIDVTHIDYYRDWSRAQYAKKRSEWGLDPVPLIVKGCLSLVWSAPA